MTETTTIYAATALLAALAAYLLLRGRAGRLGDKPAKDSVIGQFGGDIRLRDLFRLAVMMEEEGIVFYARMGEKAVVPETKELCASLAEAEEGHRRLFQDKLDKWRPLPPNRATWPVFIEQVKKWGFFGKAPGAEAGELEMAEYAIRQEIKTAEFYALFEKAFPEAWKREQLRDLAQEERLHERRLRAAYPRLNV